MNASRKLLVCLQLVVLLLMVGGTAPASAESAIPKNNVPPQLEHTARSLTRDLERQCDEVARGYFELYTQDDCPYSYDVLHTCLANNPAAPYVLPIVPAWPDEWVDPATVGMMGPTPEGYNASYRFDPREAIVILAQMPPPARYFGLQTYLLSRQGKWDETSTQYQFVEQNLPTMFGTFFTTLPKNDKRLELFADLSDPINNVVIQNGSGAVWNEMRYFVSTPDQNMDHAVRQALSRLGIPDNDVFTEQIPSTLGDTKMAIGLNKHADDFGTVIRYAMPDDGGGEGTASSAWREGLPLVVLRIRDTPPAHRPRPYPWVGFEARSGTTPPETALGPDLVMLAKEVCSKWGQPCDEDFNTRVRPFLNMEASALNMTGPECVKVGMNCLAPDEDTVYFMSPKLSVPAGRVYAVVGALGTQTKNATYVGLGLNESLYQLGFGNIEDDKLAGTAAAYDVPYKDLFFVQYLAKDCTGLETPDGSPCYSIGNRFPDCNLADPTCNALGLSLRTYLLPNSQRGPAPVLTLNPLLIPLQAP
jgi:hypothetical protein